jgi:PhnB protein
MNDQTAVQTRPDDRVMQGVIPYLAMIPGRAGEAADFYIKAFAVKDLGRHPLEGQPDHFINITIEINGGALMLSDMGNETGGPLLHGHLQLVRNDGQEWWDRAIAAGCVETSPYQRMFWGDDWGLMRDPFGVEWAILQPGPQG